MKRNRDPSDNRLIGLGLYSVPEAHQITRVPAATIRRWIGADRNRRADGFAEAPSLRQGHLLLDGRRRALTFLDLLDIRIVGSLRKYGVRWTIIREAERRACDLFGTNHPLSTKRFRADGRRIFDDLGQSGRRHLLAGTGAAFVFDDAIPRSLYEGIEFDKETDEALRWYPLWPGKAIVVDPNRAFGRPIATRSGVPAEILATAARVEDSEVFTARTYEVSVVEVRAALQWQKRLAA